MAIEDRLLKVIRNSGWLLLDKASRLFFGLLVGAWLARSFGPEKYGELSYCIAFIAFFQTLCLLGLDAIVVRELVKNKDKAAAILGTTFRLRICCGFFCSVIIAVYGILILYSNTESDIGFMLIILGFLLVTQSADTIDLWYQSLSLSKIVVRVKFVSCLISNMLKIYFIIIDKSIIYFSILVLLEGMISFLLLFYVYKTNNSNAIRWSYDKNIAKYLLTESWPFIISGLSIILYVRLDQIFIKHFFGAKELGIYAAAIPLSSAWNFVPVIISISLAPLVAKIKKESELEYNKLIYNIFRGFVFLGLLISFGTLVFSDWIIHILYGERYDESIWILKIHGFTNLFICVGVAQSIWIVNERLSKLALVKTISGALFCIGSNLLLLPMLGIQWAAITAVLSQAVSAFFANIFFAPKIFKMQVRALLLLGYKCEH